jgi:hypothetical protein
MAAPDPHPGLSKIRAVPLFRAHRVVVLRTLAGRVRELVEAADVVSEGAVRDEGGSLVYYGTTSLLVSAEGHGLPAADVATLFRRDPHVRLLAVRVARRELGARVSDGVGTLLAEVVVEVRGRMVAVEVDVVAPIEARREAPRARS